MVSLPMNFLFECRTNSPLPTLQVSMMAMIYVQPAIHKRGAKVIIEF